MSQIEKDPVLIELLLSAQFDVGITKASSSPRHPKSDGGAGQRGGYRQGCLPGSST